MPRYKSPKTGTTATAVFGFRKGTRQSVLHASPTADSSVSGRSQERLAHRHRQPVGQSGRMPTTPEAGAPAGGAHGAKGGGDERGLRRAHRGRAGRSQEPVGGQAP